MKISNRRSSFGVEAGIFALLVGLCPWAATAQTGGNQPKAGKTSQDGFTVIDLLNPISGASSGRSTIRAFQVYSTTGCTGIMLKIFRPGLLNYELIGTSNLQSVVPRLVQTLRCEIPVRDGDLVGFTAVDVGGGALDYDDSDATKTDASVIYQGDVGTVEKAAGTLKPYVRSIKVLGIPSAIVPVDFEYGGRVPVVTKAEGITGTHYRTEATLFNPSTTDPNDVTMTFIPTGKDGTADGVAKTAKVTLKALETVTIPDVIGTTFQLASGTGTLSYASTTLPIYTRWRIVNEAPNGNFGQDIPVVQSSDGLVFDTQTVTANGDFLELIGAEESDAFRTNLGVLNFDSATELEFNLQPYDLEGKPLADPKIYKLPKLSHQQWNRVLTSEFGLPSGTKGVRFKAWPNEKSLTARLFVYLSIIDNQSEDPVFVRGAKRSSF